MPYWSRVSVPNPSYNSTWLVRVRWKKRKKRWWEHNLITRIFLCTYPEQPICTSLPFIFRFILLFIKSQYTVFCTSYCFAHLIVLHILLFCTFYSIAHFTLISLFYHIYALVLCYFYIILNFYYFALSTERTWFDYISLLIIPCIIYYVTNKETLKPWPWTNPQQWGGSLLLCSPP